MPPFPFVRPELIETARSTRIRASGAGAVEQSGQCGQAVGGFWATRAGAFARVRMGRLVEVRIGRLPGLVDIESLNAAVFAAVRSVGPGAVVCADHRRAAAILSADQADAWSRAMRGANRSVGRSAILLHPANTTFNLQVERVVQCAGHERRRVFTERKELQDWLDVDLTETERAGLRAFLSDDPA